MILVDAIYINIGGGKVLLDYLIRKFNDIEHEVFYLLDERVRNNHEEIKGGKFCYMDPDIFKRHSFYLEHRNDFEKVLCFGNLPPNIRLSAVVYTYFHQPLFLHFDRELPLLQRIKLTFKTFLLARLKKNTDFWIVQSELVKQKLAKRYTIKNSQASIMVIPFYASIGDPTMKVTRKPIFLYVSSGEPHKNHKRLIEAFVKFYDQHKMAELHVTVEEKYDQLCHTIEVLGKKGYPVFNHGIIPQKDLIILYQISEYLVFPSLAESFGLGLIEAIENGCKIIGADKPYMHAVCIPSVTFDPESVDSIEMAMNKAIFEKTPPSKQLVFDNVDELTQLFI